MWQAQPRSSVCICTSYEVIFRQISIWRACTSHMCKNNFNSNLKRYFLFLILFICVLHFTLGPQTRFLLSSSQNRTGHKDRKMVYIFSLYSITMMLLFFLLHAQNKHVVSVFFTSTFYGEKKKTRKYFLWALRRQPLSVELITQTVIVVCRKKHTELVKRVKWERGEEF